MTDSGMRREWRPDWPCPVELVWSHWRRGASDPTYRVDEAGRHWRGLRTPVGPATLCVQSDTANGLVIGESWGAGAEWALDHLPTMLGADDDPTGMPLLHEALRAAVHRMPDLRIGRGGVVLEALIPAVIEQKVTGQEARTGFGRLARRFGELAPGPGASLDLWILPDAPTIRSVPSWDWLSMSIDGGRSRTLVGAARVADALQRTVPLRSEDADARLRSLPGIGVWTSAEIRARAHGDPDAVSLGDYHVARSIGWALVGQELDDDGLAELLEPYRGHRYRVQRLIELGTAGHPRRGPRMAPRTHLPTASGDRRRPTAR